MLSQGNPLSDRPIRRFLLVLLATSFALSCAVGRCAETAKKDKATRPNVIVLLTDDQGYGDLSCHGNPVLKTPNLDRLHSESVRFTDFHVAPMCTPTRSELMTGVDALRNGAMNVSSGRALLRRDLPTMANAFAAAGYRTGQFGKWHLGDMYPYRPKDRGFEKTVCFHSSYIGSAADAWENDYFNDHYLFNDEYRPVKGYCTDVFFDEAIKWIKQRNAEGEPFFVYLPTNAAHGPHFVPKRYRKEYEKALSELKTKKQIPRDLARYFGMIANIDDNLGRLEKLLKETGLRDNTIIVYMSDNGGTVGVPFYNAGMRGHKVQLWEGGHRLPCFVRWPAKGIGGGRDVDTLAECQDIFPTLIDLCGLEKPAGAEFDGTSLAKVLQGESQPELKDRMLVVQFSRMPRRGLSAKPSKDDAAVLWKKWRLLRGRELYDLSTDPHQDRNVIGDHPEIAKKLQQHYDKWWAEIAPTLDTFQPSVIGSDQQNPTRLCACEWADTFLDQMGQVRRGVTTNGFWHVETEQPGSYRFSLSRYPREADVALTKASPVHVGEDCRFGKGTALPIAKARLRVGSHDESIAVEPDDKEASFTVTLPKGRTTVKTWFYDKDGKPLCGAYYVYVERLDK